jgi:hypothetical protein
MRRLIILGSAFLLVAALIVGGVIYGLLGGGEGQFAASGCNAMLGPVRTDGTVRGAQLSAADLDAQQLGTVATIVDVGKQRQVPPLAWQVAIQAGMTESGLRNLDHGDRDSVGIFQMRPSMGWGSLAQLMDPTYEVNKFFDVLLAVPGWNMMRPGQAAQAVERSAFPDRYNNFEALAVELLGSVGQIAVTNLTGCGVLAAFGGPIPANGAAGAAIAFAQQQLGKPYLWGGTGPDMFDCSGLMLRAFQSAGIILPRTAAEQFNAGQHLAVADAQPGDLLFWATNPQAPDSIHHVALYLGGGQILEAPTTGIPVRIRAVSLTENELVPLATRPGT